jgi:hypothetical protein
MLCAARPSFLAPTTTAHHPGCHHHIISAHRMRPESRLRERLSTIFTFNPIGAPHTCGRIQQLPCTTTWEYRHLINGSFFFFSLVSVKQRHRYQVLRHFGTSGDLEGISFTCTTMSIWATGVI